MNRFAPTSPNELIAINAACTALIRSGIDKKSFNLDYYPDPEQGFSLLCLNVGRELRSILNSPRRFSCLQNLIGVVDSVETKTGLPLLLQLKCGDEVIAGPIPAKCFLQLQFAGGGEVPTNASLSSSRSIVDIYNSLGESYSPTDVIRLACNLTEQGAVVMLTDHWLQQVFHYSETVSRKVAGGSWENYRGKSILPFWKETRGQLEQLATHLENNRWVSGFTHAGIRPDGSMAEYSRDFVLLDYGSSQMRMSVDWEPDTNCRILKGADTYSPLY